MVMARRTESKRRVLGECAVIFEPDPGDFQTNTVLIGADGVKQFPDMVCGNATHSEPLNSTNHYDEGTSAVDFNRFLPFFTFEFNTIAIWNNDTLKMEDLY
ncbi:uncharacterized protein [Neodiprion pinetum]|uniref:uncharacterized protein n=1 Tax=Neodiprion pinetum TaxID=441929 RepID=UPI0037120191